MDCFLEIDSQKNRLDTYFNKYLVNINIDKMVQSIRSEKLKYNINLHRLMMEGQLLKDYEELMDVAGGSLNNTQTTVPDGQPAADGRAPAGGQTRADPQGPLTELENLNAALSQKAFKGELDLSRVPLPQTGIHHEGHEDHEENNEKNLPALRDLRREKA
jgi:hypothetical protein